MVEFVYGMQVGMDQCARDYDPLISGVGDGEDYSEECYCIENAREGQISLNGWVGSGGSNQKG